MVPQALDSLVDEWLRLDQDPITRKEILDLRDSGNTSELGTRLRNRIEFGTAGLRGPMEAGFSRMNGLTVIQASQGLCQYVLRNVPDAAGRGVCIGHDHRHNSFQWAELTAAAFIAYGVKVYLLEGLVHTPTVPFCVQHLGASAGVMITASHNPKQDNGYKVYWSNAVQIIAPHDAGIAKSITQNLEPTTWDTGRMRSSPLLFNPTEDSLDHYFHSLEALCHDKSTNQLTAVRFVNTSMHGVSHPFVVRAFKVFGLPPFVPVKEQQDPDPEFSTVKFPNPEEKGALDLAIATADREGISYVLAQDPDSDRFSAAEKRADGTWMNFTGDQLGTLFAARTLYLYQKTNKPIEKLAMVASTVSSKMIEAMAAQEGFKFVECLTGFKFIGNTALDLVKQGFDVPFGYEEAIGFMFGTFIRDKDGVAATVIFAELAATLHSQGKTITSYLLELYDRYGYFEFYSISKTSNSYFVCHDPATVEVIFSNIRDYDSNPSTVDVRSYPRAIAGLPTTRIIDLTTGYDSANPPLYKPALPLSSGHMIQFRAGTREGNGVEIVLTVRTSGTEPKIKYYLEGNGGDKTKVRRLLSEVVNELGETWLGATKHGLRRG